jgi:hypothetical protein
MSYWLLDIGLYPARPAERFARRMPISLPQEASLAAHRLPPTNDPGVHPAYPGRPRGRAGHAQPPPRTTARSKPTPRLAQHRLRQLRAPGSDSGRRRAGHGRSGRPRRPRPSQPYGCLPTAALQDLTSAGHSGRGNAQTPDAHTGRRTADAGQRTPGRSDARTGHWTLVTWTGKRGHWSPAADTGHRTPDAGRGRGQVTTARPASGPPEPPRRATARWDAQPCSCGRAPAALGSPCRLGGEAAFQREIASRRQLLGRSARVERRLGALLSSDQMGGE